MNIINTHSHVYSEEFDQDRDDVIQRAKEAGIQRLLMPNIDVHSIPSMHSVAGKYPGYCIPMMGLHPTSVNSDYKQQLSIIQKHLFQPKSYIAVGEIGIDLYWDKTFLQEQISAFETQLQWSIDMQLPVVIHNRDAFSQVMQCIQTVGRDKLRGVFHSFGGTCEELEEILSLPGFMIGINGVVTFKNAKLETVMPYCPLDRLVIETDDPYLAPVPYRGKRNEPAYIVNVVSKLSEILSISPEILSQTTSDNACRIFGRC